MLRISVSRKEGQVKYCPIGEMIGDYMTKPLVGSKFKKFRDLIMNLTGIYHQVGQQEYVGEDKLTRVTFATQRTKKYARVSKRQSSSRVPLGTRKTQRETCGGGLLEVCL
jgi:hypothetical protein